MVGNLVDYKYSKLKETALVMATVAITVVCHHEWLSQTVLSDPLASQ